MAVFKVEKNKGYTCMSNYHLRDKKLSLKAKGLLSQMLSLPDNWDYTLAGLASINKESIDAIRTAVLELENAGYIERYQGRDKLGKLLAIEYTIYEKPKEKPLLDFPITDKKDTKQPLLDFPITDKPISENPMQLNKDIINKDIQSKDISINHIMKSNKEIDMVDNKSELESKKDYEIYFNKQTNYDILVADNSDKVELLAEIKLLWLEIISCNSKNKHIRIAGESKSIEVVKSQFLKLTKEHIEYVLLCLEKQNTKINNIKNYMLTVLYNAPMTMEIYYQTLVQHDMAHGKL